ncbi:uncharacterized protein PG986_009705 [Apiospora aurea]|uniref:Uncharacterized protein n=1 Tax=Apiospora aurea TaxID=335848 RepID=A0ABR1Q8G0_9PEZI
MNTQYGGHLMNVHVGSAFAQPGDDAQDIDDLGFGGFMDMEEFNNDSSPEEFKPQPAPEGTQPHPGLRNDSMLPRMSIEEEWEFNPIGGPVV